MRNPSREIDKTHLSIDLAEERGLIHRDYLGHCLRWSHVAKFLNKGHTYKDAIVLDVGCGKEMPLAKTLYVNKMTPLKYVGVDANKFSIPDMLKGKKIPITIWPETDFCALEPADVGLLSGSWLSGEESPDFTALIEKRKVDKNFDLYGALAELRSKPRKETKADFIKHIVKLTGGGFDLEGNKYRLPNVLTCFEVLEHVTPSHCRQMLQHFQTLTSDDCHYFISTPCYNGSAAGNHINEATFSALGALVEDLGFNIDGVYGTFASISDYEDELSAVTTFDRNNGKLLATTDLRPIFSALRNYYDTNVLSVIFAPLFPSKSRNCLWHLTKKVGDAAKQERLFSALESIPGPWSQSADWRDLAGPRQPPTVEEPIIVADLTLQD